MNANVETARMGLAASGVIVYGLTLNEWVAAVTILYLILQIIILIPRAYKIVASWIGR